MDNVQVKKVVSSMFTPFIKDLEYLTNIDSVTGNIEGSRKIANWLQDRVKKLSGTVEVRDNDHGVYVIARFKGNGKKRALLVVHTDTVMGTEGGKRLFRLDENNLAYGAGVGDCKASAVQMLYLVEAMQQMNTMPYSELIVFFDAEEEIAAPFELEIAKELAQKADYAIICDTGRPNWGVCTKRKAVARYTLEIAGRSGHAGNAPHSAINAAAEMGYLITKIHKLATPITEDPDKYTSQAMIERGISDHGQFIPENSINIAMGSTNNDKFNIIPDGATLKVEVRCYQMSEQERIDGEIRKICENPTIRGAKVTISGGILKPPMEKNENAAKLFDIYKNVVKREYGDDVVEWTAGGLTIGNVTSEYIPTIDAVGVDVDPQCEHSLAEFTDLNSFEPRTVALIHLLNDVDAL